MVFFIKKRLIFVEFNLELSIVHTLTVNSLSNLSFRLKVRLNIEVTLNEFYSTKCFENFDYLIGNICFKIEQKFKKCKKCNIML